MPHDSKASPRDDKDAKAGSKAVRQDDDAPSHNDKRADAKEAKFDSGDDGSDLVHRVIAFFFDDDEFARTFERFAEENCQVFDLHGDEMKLEYTEIYNRFTALFDEKLEEYIISQGATIKQFYQQVRAAYDRDRESSDVLSAQILVATADFDVFVIMMRQTKESMMLAKH